ncbi:MAG TPA: hypothetical protein VNT30_08575 [Stellaceae bacterium]|nr:hypothetical protein [Stellaceae bacterium]
MARLPGVVLALVLLAAGLTLTTAFLRRLPADAVIAEIRSSHVPSQDDLRHAVDSARASLAILPTPDASTDLAVIGARLPLSAGGVDAAAAVAYLRDALRQVPADSLVWSDFTQAELHEGALPQGVEAFKVSMLTAPFRPALTWWRCSVGLRLYAYLDADTKELMISQFRYAWAENRWRLMGVAVAMSAVALVRQAITPTEPHAEEFDRILANTHI